MWQLGSWATPAPQLQDCRLQSTASELMSSSWMVPTEAVTMAREVEQMSRSVAPRKRRRLCYSCSLARNAASAAFGEYQSRAAVLECVSRRHADSGDSHTGAGGLEPAVDRHGDLVVEEAALRVGGGRECREHDGGGALHCGAGGERDGGSEKGSSEREGLVLLRIRCVGRSRFSFPMCVCTHPRSNTQHSTA